MAAQMTGVRKFEVVNVSEPNLLRDMFSYTQVPKIVFDDETAPLCLPDEIWITDTTFRDGQQARPPYTVEQIVSLYKLLARLSGENGIVRQCEFFLYTDKDREAVEKCRELGFKYPEITGWIRAVKSDFKLVKEMGLKETGILTSASDYHIYLKLKKDRKQVLEDYLGVVRAALEEGVLPRCHFEDATRADFYGFIIPFAQRLMELSEEAKIPVKIRVCDTMGYGVPFPEAKLPRSVPKIMKALREEAGVPSHLLEWHGHNDFHKGLVNATTAWLYGCSALNGTLLGFGERTGNTPVEALIMDYISIKGDSAGIDTTAITDIADYLKERVDVVIPPNYPLVGTDFNVTRAGIHADGILKCEEIYNIFDTKLLLKRPIGIGITDKSGHAGIAEWINLQYNLEDGHKVTKDHPGVHRIQAWVMEQYEHGRITAISDEEMKNLVKQYMPDVFVSEYDEIKQHVRDTAKKLMKQYLKNKDMLGMDRAKQEAFLEKLIEKNPFVQLGYVAAANGVQHTRLVSHKDDEETFKENEGPGTDFSQRPWFKKAIDTREICVSDFYVSLYTGALCLTASAPIWNKKKEALGVVGLDVRFEDTAKLK